MSDDPVGSALHSVGRIARALEKLAEQHVPHNDKMAKELRQAKAIGQLTLLVGSQKLRAFWESTEKVADAPAGEPTHEPVLPTESLTPPWPDYDALSGTEILSVLEGSDDSLRQAVLVYERATRGRRSILDALGDA